MPRSHKGKLIMSSSTVPPSLREAVELRLRAHNPEAAERFAHSFLPVTGETSAQEIARLNRYWRDQLCQLGPDQTLAERDHLVDVCQPHDWMRLFDHGVLPTVLVHNLPMV